MKLPDVKTGADTLVKEFGLYHGTRLCADPSLSDMATRWDAQQERMKARILELEAARAKTMTAMASRDGFARALAEEVRGFYGALVAKTNNNRRSPLFRTYFPEGLRAVLGVGLQVETQRAGVLVEKLAQEPDRDLAAHSAPLRSALDALAGAVAGHQEAADVERQAFGRIEQEKFAWLDLYKLDHRTLEQRFYKDSTKADSYFKPSRKAKAPAAVPPAVHLTTPKEATA